MSRNLSLSIGLRSLAFGSIGAGYTLVESAFNDPLRMIYLQNLTDGSLMFSFDGINDHFPVPIYGYLFTDLCQNKTVDRGFFTVDNFKVYVKQLGVPTVGSVYVTGFN